MKNSRKFYKIKRSYDPSIIGLNDAGAQVEILNKKAKHSFANENERKYFNDFTNKNKKDTNRISMDNFVVFDMSKISIINVVKTKKRAKEVDVIYYMPRFSGFDIVFSKKLLNVIEKYKLPEYNKIKIRVAEFDTEYYLIGLPLIDIQKIDFQKSTFYTDFYSSPATFNNYDDYKNSNGLTDAKNIVLKDSFEYDVLKIPFGIYFSEKLITETELIDYKALEVNKDITLEC